MHTTYVNRKSEKKKSETELRRLDESTYTKSLVYTNRLIMKEFGAKNNRKVPPHMPHMINKKVMKELEVFYFISNIYYIETLGKRI